MQSLNTAPTTICQLTLLPSPPLWPDFWTSGHWVEAMTLHNNALAVAQSVGDLSGEASALHDLGTIQYCRGDYAEAAATQRRARELYHALGYQLGEANA